MNVIPSFQATCLLGPAFALLVGQAVFAHAQTVLIDFGNDTTYRSLSVHEPRYQRKLLEQHATGPVCRELVDHRQHATTIDIGWDTPRRIRQLQRARRSDRTAITSTLERPTLPFTDIDAVALGNLGGALEGPFDLRHGCWSRDSGQTRPVSNPGIEPGEDVQPDVLRLA